MKSHLWQAKLFQNFLGDHVPPDPSWLACAFGNRFNLLHLLCFLWTPEETSAKNLDQISGSQKLTKIKRLHYGGSIALYGYRYHCETETALSYDHDKH